MATSLDVDVFEAAFDDFRKELDVEQEIRDNIREAVKRVEQEVRDMQKTMHKIHLTDDTSHEQTVKLICATGRQHILALQTLYQQLAELIPNQEYYKYHDHFRFVTQRTSFYVCLVVFLESESLCSREDVCQLLGVQTKKGSGFHLDLEDYLHGLLSLASELSRLCLNAVSRGDMGYPFKISVFLADLDAGFRLLNLKNDSLRKRFDALKYDVRRVEEVVYDLTVRDLKPK